MAEPGRPPKPDAVIGMINGCRAPPQVGIMVDLPAWSTIVDARRLPSPFPQVIHHIKQRFVQGRKTVKLGWPIIHLYVDIRCVLAAPGRRYQFIPDSLQVGWLGTRP